MHINSVSSTNFSLIYHSTPNIISTINGIEKLNRNNFPSWKNKLEIDLGMFELDYALENDKSEAPIAGVDGFDEFMETYKKNSVTWERSNRMSLKIMKGAITEGILGAIPDSTDAKKYMASIEEKCRGNDKQYSLAIMHKLINTKHHVSRSVREHIMYLCDLGAKLNTLKMGFDDPFMVHLALVSLADEYGNLVSSYNNMKKKWIIDELISHVLLEEERLKKSNKDHINNVGNKRKFHGKGDINNVKKNKPQSTYSKYENGESSRLAQSKKDGKVCHFCGDDTHYKNDCVKWLTHKGEDYIIFIDESLYVNFSLHTWWIDSGATVHICNSLQGFIMKTHKKGGAKPKGR
jgi:hypothetical protein